MFSKSIHSFFKNHSINSSPLLCLERSHCQLFNNSVSGDEKLAIAISVFRVVVQTKYLALILTSLIALYITQKKLFKQKNWIDNLPGPRTYPIVGGLLYFSADLTKTFKIIVDWNKKYGPIFRSEGLFNDPYVYLNKPQHVQAILSSNHLGLVSKPNIPYNNIFGQFLKNGLLVSEGEYWKSHRRVLSRAFVYKSFYGYAKLINQYSKRLVIDLKEMFPDVNNVEPKQISNLIHCCSLQIICASVMGLDLYGSKEGAVFNENFQRYKIISCKRASYFWFLLDFFWKLHPISREYNQIIENLNNITRKCIESRSNNNVNGIKSQSTDSSSSGNGGNSEDYKVGARSPRNMIDEMLASDMTQEEILVEANTVIVAGYESTSLTIQFMLFLLALHPEHQQACQEEVDELFDDPLKCQDGNYTMEAISEMKYLERCCFETLRLFPVIFMFLRKIKVPVKLEDNLELPAGMNVIFNTYSIHRNPDYYAEPLKFNPDRFLPENGEKRHPYAFIPFGAGIRNCIGYKFALIEIKAVIAHILRHFHVSTVDKMDDVPIFPSIVMTPVRDYKFILKRRSDF